MRSLTGTIKHSLLFYKKDALNQVIIVALLAAIITGSLLTGDSVRASLRKGAIEKLGKASVVISSGLRYFDPSLAERLAEHMDDQAVSFLETDGYCQNFSTGVTALNTKIYGIEDEFWKFHSIDSVVIPQGSVAVNRKLAQQAGINAGDDIIIRFTDPDPIPENAPFAPSKENDVSKVMKVALVLGPEQMGNFSLGISQLEPLNIFMDLDDIGTKQSDKPKANRLIIQNAEENPVDSFRIALSHLITPSDIGLKVRRSLKTGEPEIISDRIFIDSIIVAEITGRIATAAPVITYLGNNFQVGSRSAPYSFVTASAYSQAGDNDILINRWLADDLHAKKGDTLKLTWYDPGYSRRLEERGMSFIITEILPDNHYYSDPYLMPDFPGISGSTTCSGWDAGIPILLDRIRDKDESYWNKYKGTPKAFISYKTGRKIWGSNFGPATSLRFPDEEDPDQIISKLSGTLDPLKTGFTISDIKDRNIDAAREGVDFSSLFLSLSFFIIVSCMILLSLAISMFFDSRRDQVRTYYALGFKNRNIRNLLLSETLIISASGALIGVLLGYLFNILAIMALNSVWRGAVQTNTLSPGFSIMPFLAGFISTIIISLLFLLFKSGKFLRKLGTIEKGDLKSHSGKLNFLFLSISLMTGIILLIMSFRSNTGATELSFISGVLLFSSLILGLRQYYLMSGKKIKSIKSGKYKLAKQFYRFNPAHAITPVVFIAAGIFAVIITGANRKIISDKMLLPSGGTGGFLLWAESAVPVREDLSTLEGRKEFGLDENGLKDLIILQARRLSGDDASCLNLNHITAPPVLGIEPDSFISRGAFSFASMINSTGDKNPWSLLDDIPSENTIYGIADQTVLQWGLKIKAGDTLKYRAENGQTLNIVISAGLESSVFQGYLLIGRNNFDKYFPSVGGSSIFLGDGKPGQSGFYIETLSERLQKYGMYVTNASDKLASFFIVTNTYLNVFMVLGLFGMILGVAGLGFILIRNFNQRKREFALMLAAGYTSRQLRIIIMKDHFIILFWGVLTGIASGLVSTLYSLRTGSEMPWSIIVFMVISIVVAGIAAILFSVRTVRARSLIIQLRRE